MYKIVYAVLLYMAIEKSNQKRNNFLSQNDVFFLDSKTHKINLHQKAAGLKKNGNSIDSGYPATHDRK